MIKKKISIISAIFIAMTLSSCSFFSFFEIGDDIDTTDSGTGFTIADNKTDYTTLDIFDTANELVVMETFTNKEPVLVNKNRVTYQISLNGSVIDSSKSFPDEGDYLLTVNYKNYTPQTLTFNVSLYETDSPIVSLTTSIKKTSYALDEEFSLDGYNCLIEYENGVTINASYESLTKYDSDFSLYLVNKINYSVHLNPVSYVFETTDDYALITECGLIKDEIDILVTTSRKVTIEKTYADWPSKSVYGYNADICPIIGSPKLLIIPIWFTDSANYIASDKKESVREDIRKAYIGSQEETGWQSVSSYYFEESFGKLSLQGTVADWYEPKKSSTFYTSSSLTGALVREASDNYFSTVNESRLDYDYDRNGFLDGVILIYASPDYYTGNHSNGNLWAYRHNYNIYGDANISAPVSNNYFWASYDFLYRNGLHAKSHTGYQYGYPGNNSNTEIETETLIHEMGHMFGLLDYYDYSSESYSPAGGYSMQDFNVGGHDPFSVMSLGWANPYIPTTSCEIELSSFTETGEFILLTPEWNSGNSAFDEYILVELYTPTGLNELGQSKFNRNPYFILMDRPVVRVWHVDARLYGTNGAIYTNPTTAPVRYDHLAKNSFAYDANGISTDLDNEDDRIRCSSINDDFCTLQYIRNKPDEAIRTKTYQHYNNAFGNGSSFSISSFASQFPYGSEGKLNNGKTFNWTFTIAISGSGSNAKATINLTKTS